MALSYILDEYLRREEERSGRQFSATMNDCLAIAAYMTDVAALRDCYAFIP